MHDGLDEDVEDFDCMRQANLKDHFCDSCGLPHSGTSKVNPFLLFRSHVHPSDYSCCLAALAQVPRLLSVPVLQLGCV